MATNESETQISADAARAARGPTRSARGPAVPRTAAGRAQPPTDRPDPAEALRTEYADIASLAAQAARLGVTVDAADAMRKGISAEALRRTVLDTLASRAEATT